MNALWQRLRARPERAQLTAFEDANGLSRADAKLCWRLGVELAPDLPLSIFVRPSLWEAAVAQGRIEATRASAIVARLFG